MSRYSPEYQYYHYPADAGQRVASPGLNAALWAWRITAVPAVPVVPPSKIIRLTSTINRLVRLTSQVDRVAVTSNIDTVRLSQ